MGHLQAAEFGAAVAAGQIQRRVALEWHITANHFPPLPIGYVDVAETVIDRLDGQYPEFVDFDELVPLPDLEVLPREVEIGDDGVARARLGTLVEILHLDGFINWGD